MIDRAACAGVAVGAGLLLLFEQVPTESPNFGLIVVGFLLVLGGGLVWGDLRDVFHNEKEMQRGRNR